MAYLPRRVCRLHIRVLEDARSESVREQQRRKQLAGAMGHRPPAQLLGSRKSLPDGVPMNAERGGDGRLIAVRAQVDPQEIPQQRAAFIVSSERTKLSAHHCLRRGEVCRQQVDQRDILKLRELGARSPVRVATRWARIASSWLERKPSSPDATLPTATWTSGAAASVARARALGSTRSPSGTCTQPISASAPCASRSGRSAPSAVTSADAADSKAAGAPSPRHRNARNGLSRRIRACAGRQPDRRPRPTGSPRRRPPRIAVIRRSRRSRSASSSAVTSADTAST